MKVFLSGCHGVGKTTIVNKISTGLPLVKIVDSDLMIPTGQGFSQQMIRMDNNIRLLKQIREITYPVIIDRYFGDNWIYMEEVISTCKLNDYEAGVCREKQRQLMNILNSIEDVFVVYIHDDYQKVFERIQKRNRENMLEEDPTWTIKIFNRLAEAGKKHYTVMVDGAIEKIKPLLY